HTTQDGLSVVITTPEQVFNEFSSGTPDAAAIRNFVRMIYQRPSPSDTLKYLLFIGDGSFDHKSITASNINFVMTYQSKNSLNPISSFVTDDFFGLLDATDYIESSNSGLVDIGIGRLPVISVEEAQHMVDKIYSYTDFNNKGDWINSLCFIGDDEDNNIHMRDADRLATYVDTVYPHFFLNKIYLDAFPQERSATSESYPEVNRIINEQVNNGILIFNYTGHGGENGLAHERILTIDNINSWKNKNKLSIFMTATCEFSRFDNHKYVSAGERVLLNPNGGGIALFSTTRLVYSSPNYILNKNFYRYVFEKNHKDNYYSFGDIMRLAKNTSGTTNNKRNFTLLGDPALKIPLAHFNVVTDSINHKDVNDYTDTLKALSKVTVHGHISDPGKNVVTNYNGIVYPMVLDKKRTITTLANDGGTPMEFKSQNNILYKGKASVVNGQFQYTFVVPKDISYNFDKGKISYYSLSSNSDAKGFFNNFIIGGTDNEAKADNNGPAIKLYMNDENFVSGGVTDENPVLYAILTDSSGINTVGSGIGHDITAVLDNNTSDIIVLNDYYEADIDDYQKGKIEYLFNKMEDGEHQLKLKVWDVYNNSSEEYLDFLVAESEELAIKNLLNYPNPFTERTAFYFDHNRPNESLEVMIQVFTVTGKLVKTIHSTINSNGFRSEPVYWNGLDDFGDPIGRGVYLYQVKIRTIDGETVTKIEKLVILK
ncbi:MAG: type IX secretion system sortase PorU, partial [Bacteroidota bacterium]